MSDLSLAVAVALLVYLVVMIGLGLVAQRRVTEVTDYVLAGRRLGLGLAVPTLLATWFGAGTLLAATDEVRREGLRAAALDPLGAGVCLLLAGAFLARPLWRMQLLTLPDFYGRVYGPKAELGASLLMIPGYFGWIAAQFVALASILELYFDVPATVGLPLVAVFGTLYTLIGGMWAVTLTDAVQMALVIVGLVVLGGAVLIELGHGSAEVGWVRLWAETPPEKAVWIPDDDLLGWIGVFAAGALGNLPGQDLTQRIFAARSETVAARACLLAGALYLSLGVVPLLIGLGADILLPDHIDEAILPALAGHLLSPAMAVLLVVTVVSAVLSTIDSAILAPSTVLAHNLLGHLRPEGDTLPLHRLAVVCVASASLGLGWLGEDAWTLLETAYELGLVSLLVPLLGGVWWPGRSERAALASMVVGTGVWTAHLLLGVEGLFGTLVPVGLGSAGLAAVAFLIGGGVRRGERLPQ